MPHQLIGSDSIQPEWDVDRGLDFDRVSVQERRGVDVLLYRIDRRLNQQRMPAEHTSIDHVTVNSDPDTAFDDTLNACLARDWRIDWRYRLNQMRGLHRTPYHDRMRPWARGGIHGDFGRRDRNTSVSVFSIAARAPKLTNSLATDPIKARVRRVRQIRKSTRPAACGRPGSRLSRRLASSPL
jgi:hypothetical protein